MVQSSVAWLVWWKNAINCVQSVASKMEDIASYLVNILYYFRSIMRKFGSLSCLVYDNGRPDKTEISLKEIITERLLLPNTDDAVTSEFMCMGSNVDYTNGNSKGTFVYCFLLWGGKSPTIIFL